MDDEIINEINGTEFVVRVGEDKYRKFKVEDIFSIDDTDITREFIRQPTLFGFFSVLMANAEFVAGRAKFAAERQYAASDSAVREEAELNGNKMTEGAVRAATLLEELYTKAKRKELRTELDWKLLKAIAGALEQRANMLVSLGSQLRHEESMTGMNIRERALQKTVDDVKKNLDARRKADQV
jgi:hypothetical protein